MNICIFGDSIAWGASDPKKGGWVGRLWKHCISQDLQCNEDVDVYNLGVSGDNTEDLLLRFSTELEARLSDYKTLVVFAIGINDSQFVISKNKNRVSLDDFEANLKELIKQTKEHSSDIVFIGLTKVDESKTTPIPWNTDKKYMNEYVSQYNDKIKEVASEASATFIDLSTVVNEDDLTDGLHLSTEGHEKVFSEVMKTEPFKSV